MQTVYPDAVVSNICRAEFALRPGAAAAVHNLLPGMSRAEVSMTVDLKSPEAEFNMLDFAMVLPL